MDTRTSPSRYTVRQGDTLSSIAQRNGISVPEILQRNPGIVHSDRIQSGSSLSLRTVLGEQEAASPSLADRILGSSLFQQIGEWFNGEIETDSVDSELAGSVARELLPWRGFIASSASKYGIEPELVGAIISRETNGRNIIGDFGHGRGLMQIDDRWHGDFLKENAQGLDPESNIDYGTRYLQGLIREFDGELPAAIAAYNQGAGNVRKRLAAGESVDRGTAHGNYSADVLQRMEALKGAGLFK